MEEKFRKATLILAAVAQFFWMLLIQRGHGQHRPAKSTQWMNRPRLPFSKRDDSALLKSTRWLNIHSAHHRWSWFIVPSHGVGWWGTSKYDTALCLASTTKYTTWMKQSWRKDIGDGCCQVIVTRAKFYGQAVTNYYYCVWGWRTDQLKV